jgi:hypothetical protein
MSPSIEQQTADGSSSTSKKQCLNSASTLASPTNVTATNSSAVDSEDEDSLRNRLSRTGNGKNGVKTVDISVAAIGGANKGNGGHDRDRRPPTDNILSPEHRMTVIPKEAIAIVQQREQTLREDLDHWKQNGNSLHPAVTFAVLACPGYEYADKLGKTIFTPGVNSPQLVIRAAFSNLHKPTRRDSVLNSGRARNLMAIKYSGLQYLESLISGKFIPNSGEYWSHV